MIWAGVLSVLVLAYTAFVEVNGVFLVLKRNRLGRGPSRMPFPVMWMLYTVGAALFPSQWLSKNILIFSLVVFHLLIGWVAPFLCAKRMKR